MTGYLYGLQVLWRNRKEDIDYEYKIKVSFEEALVMDKSMKKQKKEKGDWKTLTEYAIRKEIAYKEAKRG